jgi:hypothetical protein
MPDSGSAFLTSEKEGGSGISISMFVEMASAIVPFSSLRIAFSSSTLSI